MVANPFIKPGGFSREVVKGAGVAPKLKTRLQCRGPATVTGVIVLQFRFAR